jgi:Fe-Mn family superoxide dismutase
MKPETYPFVVRPLPYGYDALVPLLDEETLHLHHDRHYQTCVDSLNHTLADYPNLQSCSLKELLSGIDDLQAAIRTPIREQGGGVYAHELYFDSLRSPDGQEPSGLLEEALKRDFGSLKAWREEMLQRGVSHSGSGWLWLLADADGKLTIAETTDQDVPNLREFTPILAVDLWEHAYYLKYQNRRADYLNSLFSLIHWRKVQRRLEELARS